MSNFPNQSRRDSHPAIDRVSQETTNLPPASGPQDINSHYWRLASCILIVKRKSETDPQLQYLTVQTEKRPTEYNLPGGKVEKGETYQQAALRELKEETNLTAFEDNLILLHEGSDGGDLLDPPVTPFWVKTYLCTKYNGIEAIGQGELSVSWRPLHELKYHKNPIWQEYHNQVFKKYLEYLHQSN